MAKLLALAIRQAAMLHTLIGTLRGRGRGGVGGLNAHNKGFIRPAAMLNTRINTWLTSEALQKAKTFSLLSIVHIETQKAKVLRANQKNAKTRMITSLWSLKDYN